MTTKWMELAEKAINTAGIGRNDAHAVLSSSDGELLSVIDAAWHVRRHFWGNRVNLHVLCNAKSGLCSEDCAFCSQSAVSSADIPRYPMRDVNEIVSGAQKAADLGAAKYCIVLSGRAPEERDWHRLLQAVSVIRSRWSHLKICVSAGLLTPTRAKELKNAGADRINHNLETSRRFFPRICTTHSYDDRIGTLLNAKEAGLELCSGGLIGMGETYEDRVDLAFTLKEIGVHSIPVNFLNPRPGTPLEGIAKPSAADCLRTLAMFRFVHPHVDIRAAGGREACLGALQVLALYVATSIFTEGYLTTPGQGYERDVVMIREAGFAVGALEA